MRQKVRLRQYKVLGGGECQDLVTGVDRVIQLGVADAERPGYDELARPR